MFLISIIGAGVAPFLVVVASYIHMKTKQPTPTILFGQLFTEVNLYTTLIIGFPLYGVVIAYLFTREYTEDTLKNLLTIPVSRISFIISKFILLFLWIMMLTLVAWALTLLLGLIGSFPGFSITLLLGSLIKFLICGGLLFLLSSPIVLLTLVMKTYVPPIILTIIITMTNLMIVNSKHKDLFPWTATLDIANNELQPNYPPEYSYIIIAVTAIFGFITTLFYFKRVRYSLIYRSETMSDLIIAFILGIVEGLAEFLPISSTGHLILVGHLLGFEGERAKTFEIVIQLGAILAIAILYHKRLVSLCNIKPLLRKEKKFNALHVFLGVFPAVVVGLLLHDVIKTYLFQPYTVVIGLVAGAFLMIFAEVKKAEATAFSLDDLTYRQALTIGLFQCLAVYPGFSRAGSTISGGLLAKVNYKTASEFSFLIALPVMVGATGLDLLKSWKYLSVDDISMFAIGFITSFIVAMLAVVTFLKLLEKIGLKPFAHYRILLAILFTLFVLL